MIDALILLGDGMLSLSCPWDVAYDWGTKLGMGGILGWVAKTLWSSAQKRVDRGRDLREKARPELKPLGTLPGISAGSFRIRLKNIGVGVARRISLAMSHCSREAHGGEIQAGAEGQTEELYFEDQPVYQERKEEPLNMVITYLDRFGNPYKTIIPFSQIQRANGNFNVDIHWNNYALEAPKPSMYTHWKIGK